MIKIRETIVVEGKYDIIRLKGFIDTQIIETRGFSIFKDTEKLDFLRKISEIRGLIVLTDSDGAGFVIRNYLKGAINSKNIRHAYIPDVFGKEKRKTKVSSEGKLGVEGISEKVLIDVLKKAGATFVEENDETSKKPYGEIKKSHLYEYGIYGREGSDIIRKELLKFLDLPSHLSVNSMLEVLNMIYTYDEFEELLDKFQASNV